MILEILIFLFSGIFLSFLELVEISGINILISAVAALSEFFVYGSYIVGADMLLVFTGIVFAWACAKLSVGVGIRLWELFPFT